MYESGTMVPLRFLLPETAAEDDQPLVAVDHPTLGDETYNLAEVYCIAPECDCRRVILNVMSASKSEHLATINWAFDEGDEDRGPFLDRLNAQSEHSRDLLKLVKELLEIDREYVERLERHYKMVKDAVADPRHPVHERLRGVEGRTPVPENLPDVPDDQLARIWSMIGLDVPRALIDETLRRGERMVSHLGRLLTDEDLWDAGPEEREGWGPIHSMFLIRAIGSPAAASHVTEFLTRALGEDWLTDEGAELVSSLGPDAIDVVWKVVTDDQAEGWGRVIAVDGLAMIGMAHEGARPRLVALLRELTSRLMEKPPGELTDDELFLVEALFDALASLHDEESRDLIRRGFRDGHSKISRADQRKLLELYEEPIEKILSDLRTDPIEHFSEGNLEELKDLHGLWDEDASDDEDWAPAERKPPPPPVVSPPKVGRNEPCPCGSGKKYKKCCLAT